MNPTIKQQRQQHLADQRDLAGPTTAGDRCTTTSGAPGTFNAQKQCVPRPRPQRTPSQNTNPLRHMTKQRAAAVRNRPTQMSLMMKANAMAGAEADVATLGSLPMSIDPRNKPANLRDPSYAPLTVGPAQVASWQQAAMHANLQANFGVGAFVKRPKPAVAQQPDLAPHTQATNCAPGQVTLKNGQCGWPPVAQPISSCPDGFVGIASRCFPIPPMPGAGAVILALKTTTPPGKPDAGAPALIFYAYATGLTAGPMASTQTHNFFVWNGQTWSGTSMDATMLSTMFIVAGQVPAGMMLAVRDAGDGRNKVVLVRATNPAMRPVVRSVAGVGVGAPAPHHTGGVKPVLNQHGHGVRMHQAGVAGPTKAKAAHGSNAAGSRPAVAVHKGKPVKALTPLGAGLAEYFRPRPARAAHVGAPARQAFYITKRGDTLNNIARAHNMSPAMLAKMNPGVILPFHTPMSGGFRLTVPA